LTLTVPKGMTATCFAADHCGGRRVTYDAGKHQVDPAKLDVKSIEVTGPIYVPDNQSSWDSMSSDAWDHPARAPSTGKLAKRGRGPNKDREDSTIEFTKRMQVSERVANRVLAACCDKPGAISRGLLPTYASTDHHFERCIRPTIFLLKLHYEVEGDAVTLNVGPGGAGAKIPSVSDIFKAESVTADVALFFQGAEKDLHTWRLVWLLFLLRVMHAMVACEDMGGYDDGSRRSSPRS